MDQNEVSKWLNMAKEYLEAARSLRDNGHFRVAYYLGGYGIECALKAMILTQVPTEAGSDYPNKRWARGGGHKLDDLKLSLYELFRENFLRRNLPDAELRAFLEQSLMRECKQGGNGKISWSPDEHGESFSPSVIESLRRAEEAIQVPEELARDWLHVTAWRSSVRYESDDRDELEVEDFVTSVGKLFDWAKERVQSWDRDGR